MRSRRSRLLLGLFGLLVVLALMTSMLATDLRAVPGPVTSGREGGLLGRVRAEKPWKAYVMPWGSGYARPVREGPDGFFLARPLPNGIYRVIVQLEPDLGGTNKDAGPTQERTHTLAVPVALPQGVRLDAAPSPAARSSIQGFLDLFKGAYLAKDMERMAGLYSANYLSTRGETLKTKMDGLRRALETIEIRSLEVTLDVLLGTDDHPFAIVAIDLEAADPRRPDVPLSSKMATALELVKEPGPDGWKIESSGAIPIPPFEERWVKQYVYLLNSPLTAVSVEAGKVTTIPGVVDLRGQ